MKNKIIKIFLVLTIIITIFNLYPVYTEAFQDPSENPGAWKPTIEEDTSIKYKSTIERLLGYINVIGIVISVVVLIIIGIKYLLGSVEEKAEYKKTMGMYLLGAVLVFSVTTIPNILYKIAYNSFK